MRKALLILSEKSSGSSILQSELAAHSDINHVEQTPHFQYETLFWLKAACLLVWEHGRDGFYQSTPPYTQKEARAALEQLIVGNCPTFNSAGLSDIELVDQGWSALCDAFGPIFLEKSPHHLLHRAALDTMVDSFARQNLDYLLIGVVRHPMAMLYSAWENWRSHPKQRQMRWLQSMENLQYLQEKVPADNLIVRRYQDIVSAPVPFFEEVCKRLGIVYDPAMGQNMHGRSVAKWKDKKASLLRIKKWKIIKIDFSKICCLQPSVIRMAESLGYDMGDENE